MSDREAAGPRYRSVKTADGLTLHALEGGRRDGPVLLFIHGYLFSTAVFGKQFAGPLARTYRLIAFDLRGHGRSDRPDDLSRYCDPLSWAKDVDCVLDAFDVERAVIVGWSLGGRVALNHAWRFGFDRIAGLNLVCSITAPTMHAADAALPPRFAALLEPDAVARAAATRDFVDACAQPHALGEDLAETFITDAMACPPSARRGARAWPLAYGPALEWVSCPLLSIVGSSDLLAPCEVIGAETRSAPDGSLIAIEGGHLAFMQNAAEFDASLDSFAKAAYGAGQR